MNCEECHDTGFVGDLGPGIKGNNQYVPCEACAPEPFKCPSCNQPFTAHLGLEGTCKQLQEALATNEELKQSVEVLQEKLRRAQEEIKNLGNQIDRIGW